MVLVDRELSRTGNRLVGGTFRADSRFCHLCQSARDETVGGAPQLLMWTDSESLLHEGIRTALSSYPAFLEEAGWQSCGIDKTFCHQVGRAHQRLLFDTLGLDPAIDYCTHPFLGNTGSVAVPITAALGLERGHVKRGDRVALFGIGSGINVLMLGATWQKIPLG